MGDGPDPTSPSDLVAHRDLTVRSADGTELSGQSWATPDPRAVLVIAHGLGEHGGSYGRVAQGLAQALAIEVVAFDFRGSGRSPGKRGFVRTYDDLVHDLRAAIGWASRTNPALPRFLLGHSNGGLVAIRTILDRNPGLSGLILSNPPFRLAARVPIWKRAVGEALMRVAPSITLATGLDNTQLTSDPEMIEAIDGDALRHDRISAPLFFGMVDSGPAALSRAREIELPTLLLLGEEDPISDPSSGRQFFEALGSRDKTLRSYPGMRHEPLNDWGRREVFDDVVQWIAFRLP